MPSTIDLNQSFMWERACTCLWNTVVVKVAVKWQCARSCRCFRCLRKPAVWHRLRHPPFLWLRENCMQPWHHDAQLFLSKTEKNVWSIWQCCCHSDATVHVSDCGQTLMSSSSQTSHSISAPWWLIFACFILWFNGLNVGSQLKLWSAVNDQKARMSLDDAFTLHSDSTPFALFDGTSRCSSQMDWRGEVLFVSQCFVRLWSHADSISRRDNCGFGAMHWLIRLDLLRFHSCCCQLF